MQRFKELQRHAPARRFIQQQLSRSALQAIYVFDESGAKEQTKRLHDFTSINGDRVWLASVQDQITAGVHYAFGFRRFPNALAAHDALDRKRPGEFRYVILPCASPDNCIRRTD